MDVFIIILFLSLGLAGMIFITSSSKGSRVMIYTDGRLYGEYNLYQNEEITIDRDGHCNRVSISNSRVCMLSSDCDNQLCVRQGYIELANESLCCVPNGVIVTIYAEGENEYDAILY